MVIPDYGRGPWRKFDSKQQSPLTYTASPMDRLAAQIFDLVVVLAPVFMLMSAPFKSRLYHGFLLENQEEIFTSIVANTTIALVLFVLYNAIGLRFFQTTPGKRLFNLKVTDVWDGRSVSFLRCLGRSVVTALSFLTMGFAFLPMLSNDRRRSLADLCFDTEVVSAKPTLVAIPNQNERSFVRLTYVAAVLAVVGMTGYVCRSAFTGRSSDSDLAAWFSDRAGHCEAVEDAVASWPKDSTEKMGRLDITLAMYAAGLVDRRCLQSEADSEAVFSTSPGANYYLAQSFVHTDDTDVSDAYLAHVCEREPKSSSCEMSQIVAAWSSEDWEAMRASFEDMKKPDAFATIWAIRFFMRQGQPEQAHLWIDRVSPNKVLAPFLQVQRVKTLWLMDRQAEARMGTLSGLESLPDDWQMDLAAWMCTQESALGCSESTSACQWLRDQHLENADQDPQLSVALLHNSECSNSEMDYASITALNSSQSWKKLIRAIAKLHSGDRGNGLKMIRGLMEDDDADEPIRAEAFRRYLKVADDNAIEQLAFRSEELPRGLWREVQPRFFKELAFRHISQPPLATRKPASDEGE